MVGIKTIVIADVNECGNVGTCPVGRCVNSFGSYYCLTDNAISNLTRWFYLEKKLDFLYVSTF